MGTRSTPVGLLQPQGSWNAGAILNPHFGNLNYLLRPEPAAPAPDRVYATNQDLWQSIIEERLRAYATLTLTGFYLFEWFPRSPGLFFTSEAPYARREALKHLDRRFQKSPIEIDYGEVPSKGSARITGEPDPTIVFTPAGKLSMLQGGVGCIRLKPIERDQGTLWLMSASSNGIAHEGFPLAVPDDLYQAHAESLFEHGAVRSRIVGKLKFLPDRFQGLFDGYSGVPYLYLEVEEITPEPVREGPALEVSVAVSFVSDYKSRGEVYASYVTFTPERKASFREAIDWLKNEYVQGGYGGRIITDFDQTKTLFPEAALSLQKVIGRHLHRGTVEEVVRLLHARGNVEQLYTRLELEEMAGSLSRVARTRIFISYSREDRRWLERLRCQLEPVVREHNLDLFVDTDIRPGSNWMEEIESALESARVAILLISANFLASEFIATVELPKLLRAARDQGTIILPLHVSSSLVQSIPSLWEIQAMNDPEVPIDTLPEGEQERVFRDAALKVQRALEPASA